VKLSWNPEDLFCYAYAVFHSPTYRQRYAEFLKIDFPRLPLTSDAKLFFILADLGEELVLLHLMRSPKLNDFIIRFPHSGNNEVEKLRYADGNVWFNRDQCFEGVEEADWNFPVVIRCSPNGSRIARVVRFPSMTSSTTRRALSPSTKPAA